MNKDDLLNDDDINQTENDIVVDEEEDASSLIEKIKKLKAKLKFSQKERQEYLTGWQRSKADYLNLKKEEEARRSEINKYAKADVLNDLISLADSFEMAFADKVAWANVSENWRKGVEYIHSCLLYTS